MVRATSYFGKRSKQDRDETAANAERILLEYPRAKSKTLRGAVSIQSPTLDGMPRNDTVSNRNEDKIINTLDDEDLVAQCDYIVNKAMPNVSKDPNWAKIIKLAYLLPQPMKDVAIQQRLGYGHTAYYDAKKEALCAFAELWPPFPTEIVTYF